MLDVEVGCCGVENTKQKSCRPTADIFLVTGNGKQHYAYYFLRKDPSVGEVIVKNKVIKKRAAVDYLGELYLKNDTSGKNV